VRRARLSKERWNVIGGKCLQLEWREYVTKNVWIHSHRLQVWFLFQTFDTKSAFFVVGFFPGSSANFFVVFVVLSKCAKLCFVIVFEVIRHRNALVINWVVFYHS